MNKNTKKESVKKGYFILCDTLKRPLYMGDEGEAQGRIKNK
jgi:hypothetical protein